MRSSAEQDLAAERPVQFSVWTAPQRGSAAQKSSDARGPLESESPQPAQLVSTASRTDRRDAMPADLSREPRERSRGAARHAAAPAQSRNGLSR